MEKKFLAQTTTACNIEVRNERNVTGTPAESRSKGQSVSIERQQGESYQWKTKGKCTRGDARSFRQDSSERGASTRCSSANSKIDDRKKMGKNSSKGKPLRGNSPPRKMVRMTLKEILTSPSPIRRNTLYKARSLLEYVNISQQKGKPYGTEEKPKFDNARTVRGTYEIDPEDTEFKDTMKNERM